MCGGLDDTESVCVVGWTTLRECWTTLRVCVCVCDVCVVGWTTLRECVHLVGVLSVSVSLWTWIFAFQRPVNHEAGFEGMDVGVAD